MLFEIMSHIKNFFATGRKEEREYTIEDGTISLPFVKEGQYILIEGSVSSDGVYVYPVSGLTDESFYGCITVLAPPKDFLSLVEEIKAFQSEYKASALTSESFGGYSYTKSAGANGCQADWRDVFRGRLNTWRKI